MSISLSTYQVKKGDTLESIAKELEIPAQALRHYHNTYCDLKNLMGHDLSGVQEVFIPPPDKIAEIKEALKNIALGIKLPTTSLTQTFYAPSYEVTERLEQQGEDEVAISYLASLQLPFSFAKRGTKDL